MSTGITKEEMELRLKSVTDQVGKLWDIINKKGFIPAFQCAHSGLYLPGDYVKEWGRKYGIGLGASPVSEVLDSDYDTAPPEITPQIRSIEQIMHPVGPTFSQVDFILVDPKEFDQSQAVCEKDDCDMTIRAKIVRARQLVNPRGRLRTMQAAWERKSR